jgi:hypothetical protein
MPTMMKSTDFVPDHGAMPLEWGGYIIRPSDEKHSSYAGFPNEPGIYAMYSRVGDLMYVGRSVAIATRLRQHALRALTFSADRRLCIRSSWSLNRSLRP